MKCAISEGFVMVTTAVCCLLAPVIVASREDSVVQILSLPKITGILSSDDALRNFKFFDTVIVLLTRFL